MNRFDSKYCVPRKLSKKQIHRRYLDAKKRVDNYLKKYIASRKELLEIEKIQSI